LAKLGCELNENGEITSVVCLGHGQHEVPSLIIKKQQFEVSKHAEQNNLMQKIIYSTNVEKCIVQKIGQFIVNRC
jgi:hypothetical protein